MADAGISRHEIDALIISTCTGYLCPGLTSYISESLGLSPEAVNVKATTNEGMGFVGRGEGMAAQAVATVTSLDRG